AYEPTTLVYNSGNSVPALAVGVPLSGYYQLYYVFPFTQQQATLLLVQRVLVGVADLAALATSFNDMAASLQGKLRELEDLSNVQRQFVSDVSHELRTPLSTIKMAADLLFEARAELDAAGGRSVELLQSQLDRFESLLVDLLEISRFDAGAATLDADLVDVC